MNPQTVRLEKEGKETHMDKSWLGPFLCKPAPKSMGFWMSFGPGFSEDIEVSVTINTAPEPTVVRLEVVEDNTFGARLGVSPEKLEPGKTYSYTVSVNGKEITPPGLSSVDLRFQTLPENPDEIEFVLMSCHGIEAYEHDPKNKAINTWRMWSKLDTYLKDNDRCRLLVLGGDQVYMDDTFKEDISNYKSLTKDQATQKAYDVYVLYWGDPLYRKAMAQFPAILMWDDHDLIDGWGSREAAKLKSNREAWQSYGALLTSAFSQMQASRNPGEIHRSSGFSFRFGIGSTQFIALDLRSGRRILDSGKSEMMSKDHRKALTETFEKVPATTETLFIVSPVTIARMGGDIETLLGSVANLFWSFGKWLGYGKNFWRISFWFLAFAFMYFSLHLNTVNAPVIVQSIALGLISVILLSNGKNFRKYFPKKGSMVLWGIRGLFVISGVYFYAALKKAAKSERAISEVIGEQLWRAVVTSQDETVGTLVGVLVAILLLAIWKSERINQYVATTTQKKKNIWATTQTYLKWGGLFALGFVVLFNWWRGLPGWKFDWGMAAYLLPLAILGIFTIVTLVVLVLETIGAVDSVAGLDDDIRDGWSSEANRDDLEWFSNQIEKVKRRGIESVVILCGDIHTAGLSLIRFGSTQFAPTAYQVTSSPMSYVTMPDIVEKLTSGAEEFEIKNEGGKKICTASNIFYRSKRNFAVVKTKGSKSETNFYFEDLNAPVSVRLQS